LDAKTRSEKLLKVKEEKKTNLKVPKKGTLISVILLCLLAGTLAYALLSNYTDIAHQLTIKGVKVSIWIWIDDVTTPTTEKTTHDWNKMGANEVADTEFLLIESISTENGTLSFTDTMNPSFGVVDFYIEYWDNSLVSWVALNWQDAIDAGTPYKDSSYLPGTIENSIQPDQMIGFRPASPQDKDIGHCWIRLTINGDPPFESTTFDTTVTITEYIP